MGAFTIDVVVGVHEDQTEFAVPFLPPCLGVDDQVFDAIAPHTPVPTVQVSDTVTPLLNRHFGDALNSCTNAERAFEGWSRSARARIRREASVTVPMGARVNSPEYQQ